MSDSNSRPWLFYIDDMIACIDKVVAYTEGFDQQQFVSNTLNYDASIRNLELIGEAAIHIPDNIRTQYSEISWRLIISTRNRLIHGYLGIDNDTLWSIIKDDVPQLHVQLSTLKAKYNQ